MGEQGEVPALQLVDDKEEICRLCFSAQIPIVDDVYPNQIDPVSGQIRLEEISLRKVRRGFSVQRRHMYSMAEALAIARAADARWKTKGKEADYQLAGFLLASVAAVHSISEDGSRVFAVYSKPEPGEPGHAEIHIAVEGMAKDKFIKYRTELQLALGQIQPPEALDVAA